MFLRYLYVTKVSAITYLKFIYKLHIKLSHYGKNTVFKTYFKLIYTIAQRYYPLKLFVSIRSHTKCECTEFQMMQTTMSHLNVLQFIFSHQWVSVTHLQFLLEASQGSEVSDAICGDAPEHLHHISTLSNPCHVKLIKNLSHNSCS